MSGILEGVRVVSMELMEAIPAGSVWLADWGAEVIRVEPLTGEMYRGTRRATRISRILKLERGEVNWGMQLFNRNKKGLAIDLKKDEGKEILYKLIQKADVFMSNYELGALKRLKMDYDTLCQLNPKLIYTFLSGYGTVGPDKDERGFDLSAGWARPGFMYLIGEPGAIPPRNRSGMNDRVAASHAVAGVCAALFHREKTGKGQLVEVSLYQSGVWTLASDIQSALLGQPMPKDDRMKEHNPLWNNYRTKDGRWVQLTMHQSDLSWSDFCKAIERPELENDSRFSNMEVRADNCGELISIIDEVIATKTMEEWEKIFKKHDLIYARVQTSVEVVTDPQALANDFFVDLNHPVGKMKVVATPVKFLQNPATVRTGAPEVGQHNEEILLDLGYSWDDIAQLKEQEVIL